MVEKKPSKKPATPKPKPGAKPENTRERLIIWLVIAVAMASIWLLLALGPKEKTLVCDSSNNSSIISFGSCH